MKKVEIYTSDTCINCTKVKGYFKENKIEYTEFNINKDSEVRKKLIGMGYMSVPLIIIDGEHVLGFDLKRINDLLNK